MGERYRPPTPEEAKAAADQRRKDAFKTVQSEVEKIQDSETFRSYLNMLSRFHEYSPSNIMLIMAQKPDATRVASYDTWKGLGRQVQRGESGLNVFVPRFPPGTTKDQQQHLQPSGYGIGRVFDVSQTAGKPLPEMEAPILEGDEGGNLYYSIGEVAIMNGLDVQEIANIPGETMGFYASQQKMIGIRSHIDGKEVPQLQKTKTMAHELAHHYAKHGTKDAEELSAPERESVAESAAYVTLAHFGLDSGSRSFPYIAVWAQKKGLLKQVMGQVQRVSSKLIDAVEQTDLYRAAAAEPRSAETPPTLHLAHSEPLRAPISHSRRQPTPAMHSFYQFAGVNTLPTMRVIHP